MCPHRIYIFLFGQGGCPVSEKSSPIHLSTCCSTFRQGHPCDKLSKISSVICCLSKNRPNAHVHITVNRESANRALVIVF